MSDHDLLFLMGEGSSFFGNRLISNDLLRLIHFLIQPADGKRGVCPW